MMMYYTIIYKVSLPLGFTVVGKSFFVVDYVLNTFGDVFLHFQHVKVHKIARSKLEAGQN